jgi:hypothetical protein
VVVDHLALPSVDQRPDLEALACSTSAARKASATSACT